MGPKRFETDICFDCGGCRGRSGAVSAVFQKSGRFHSLHRLFTRIPTEHGRSRSTRIEPVEPSQTAGGHTASRRKRLCRLHVFAQVVPRLFPVTPLEPNCKALIGQPIGMSGAPRGIVTLPSPSPSFSALLS